MGSRRLLIASSIAFAVTTATACASSTTEAGDEGGDILIAAPAELTGAAAGYGVPYLEGAELAVERINDAGGIESMDGRKLKLVVKDTESDPQRAVELLNSSVTGDKAIASIGPVSSATAVAVKGTVESLQVPWLFGSLDDSLTEDTTWGFRMTDRFGGTWTTGYWEFLQGQIEAQDMDVKTIGLIGYTAPPGPSALAGIEQRAKEAGWEVVKYTYDLAETRDFTSIVTGLKSKDVDLVLGSAYLADGVSLAKAFAASNWNPKYGYVLSAGGAFQNEFREAMGSSTENWIATGYGPWAGRAQCEELTQFAADFQERTGDPMVGLAYAGSAAVAVLADALERAGTTDAEELRDAIAETSLGFCESTYFMAGGVEFDETGDNVGFTPVALQHVGSDLEQATVWPSDVADAEPVWPAYSANN